MTLKNVFKKMVLCLRQLKRKVSSSSWKRLFFVFIFFFNSFFFKLTAQFKIEWYDVIEDTYLKFMILSYKIISKFP